MELAVPDNQAASKARGFSSRWPKGVSGNPKGRPKQKTLSESLRDLLALERKSGETEAMALARVLLKIAQGGDLGAIKEIADRTEGKAREIKDVNKDVTIRVVFDSTAAPIVQELPDYDVISIEAAAAD